MSRGCSRASGMMVVGGRSWIVVGHDAVIDVDVDTAELGAWSGRGRDSGSIGYLCRYHGKHRHEMGQAVVCSRRRATQPM